MDQINKPQLYLSGSIEFSKDPSTWRNVMVKSLCKKYTVINPKAAYCPFTKDEIEYRQWILKNFIIPDMEYVFKCNYFFVKIDPTTGRGSGTWSELSLAAYLNKHILYYLEDIKLSEMPGWSVGCLSNASRVQSIDEAIKIYHELNKGT